MDIQEELQELNETMQALVVMNMRIYDVLMVNLKIDNPAWADKLVETHTQGRTIGPLPSWASDGADASDESDENSDDIPTEVSRTSTEVTQE